MTNSNGRTADFPIDPMFLDRWSPRVFTAEPIADDDLFTIFEAARWAPSSSNLQPWRFLYAKRDTPDWPLFFDAIKEGNKAWTRDASVLFAILSKRTAPVRGSDVLRDSYSHSFDAGAAWGYAALQASLNGWVAHGIGGFEVQQAVSNLDIPDDYRIECMAAIGRHRRTAETPSANSRSPQSSFVRAGPFRTS